MKSETKIIYKRVFYKTLKRLAKISREFWKNHKRVFSKTYERFFRENRESIFKAFSIHQSDEERRR